VFHYVPLHTSPMGRRFGYRPGDLPITENLASRLLRLPLFYELSFSDVERITENIKMFLKRS
jgi:dTDP-4-amino-4,6-dideoxygalactose transaminase